MPNIRTANAVRLEFAPGALVHANLSGAAFTEDWLWVVGDEAAGIERLRRLPPVGQEVLRYGEPLAFPLVDLLELPGAAEDEADLEGMAEADGWLWIVGSHGLKRKAPKPELSDAENAKRLAKVSLDGNRRLLACVPIETGQDGKPALVRQARDGRRALRLEGKSRSTPLMKLLADDPHFADYLAIPGKDNGLDIEGLALCNGHLLLGLRGPVLRGWSAMLEIAVAPQGDHLQLQPLDAQGTLVRKHFLQLQGLGIRDLHFRGDDLYILAGPTMVLDGDIRLFRWPGARAALAAQQEPVRFQHQLGETVALPHRRRTDRAEAFCELPPGLLPEPHWLVLYDAPGAGRQDGAFTVFGDLLRRG